MTTSQGKRGERVRFPGIIKSQAVLDHPSKEPYYLVTVWELESNREPGWSRPGGWPRKVDPAAAERGPAALSHTAKKCHPERVAAAREIGISPGVVEEDGIGSERRATAPCIETGLVSWKARKEAEAEKKKQKWAENGFGLAMHARPWLPFLSGNFPASPPCGCMPRMESGGGGR